MVKKSCVYNIIVRSYEKTGKVLRPDRSFPYMYDPWYGYLPETSMHDERTLVKSFFIFIIIIYTGWSIRYRAIFNFE